MILLLINGHFIEDFPASHDWLMKGKWFEDWRLPREVPVFSGWPAVFNRFIFHIRSGKENAPTLKSKKNINFPYISIKHFSQHFWITPLLLQHQAVTSCHILTIPDPCRGTWGSKSCLSWSWASAPLRDFWRAPTWTFRCQDLPGRLIAMGWWYTYPSEKYEPMGRMTSHILWNHQPAISSNN